MSYISKADQWIIKNFQAAYLWLFDWTGVYVGTLLFIVAGGANFLWWTKHQDWMPLVFIALMGIIGAWNRHLQANNETLFNAAAMEAEAGWFRRGFTWFVLFGLILALVNMNWRNVAGELLWITYTYLICIKVRKREPKELKSLVPKLAMQGSSGG